MIAESVALMDIAESESIESVLIMDIGES